MRHIWSKIGAFVSILAICGGSATKGIAAQIYSVVVLDSSTINQTYSASAPVYTTDANGNRMVVDSTGNVAYPFPASPNLLTGMSQTALNQLTNSLVSQSGQLINQPNSVDGGQWTPSFMNANGIVTGSYVSPAPNGSPSGAELLSVGYAQMSTSGSLAPGLTTISPNPNNFVVPNPWLPSSVDHVIGLTSSNLVAAYAAGQPMWRGDGLYEGNGAGSYYV